MAEKDYVEENYPFFTEYRYIEQDVDSVYSDEYREVELGCKPADEDLAGKKSTILNFISLI